MSFVGKYGWDHVFFAREVSLIPLVQPNIPILMAPTCCHLGAPTNKRLDLSKLLQEAKAFDAGTSRDLSIMPLKWAVSDALKGRSNGLKTVENCWKLLKCVQTIAADSKEHHHTFHGHLSPLPWFSTVPRYMVLPSGTFLHWWSVVPWSSLAASPKKTKTHGRMVGHVHISTILPCT